MDYDPFLEGQPDTDVTTMAVGSSNFFFLFFFFFFLVSGGWVKIKLKLPHFHVSDTRRVSI